MGLVQVTILIPFAIFASCIAALLLDPFWPGMVSHGISRRESGVVGLKRIGVRASEGSGTKRSRDDCYGGADLGSIERSGIEKSGEEDSSGVWKGVSGLVWSAGRECRSAD